MSHLLSFEHNINQKEQTLCPLDMNAHVQRETNCTRSNPSSVRYCLEAFLLWFVYFHFMEPELCMKTEYSQDRQPEDGKEIFSDFYKNVLGSK